MYEFTCLKCNHQYEELTKFDSTEKYEGVICPRCQSDQKEKRISACACAFSNPIGTDRWTSDGSGHDYRFQYNVPNLKNQRAVAEAASHMGSDPYGSTVEKDLKLGEGIHDPEFRPGLS